MPVDFKAQVEQFPILGPFFLAICIAVWGSYHKFFIIPMFAKWDIKECPNDRRVADLEYDRVYRDERLDKLVETVGEIKGTVNAVQKTVNTLVGMK